MRGIKSLRDNKLKSQAPIRAIIEQQAEAFEQESMIEKIYKADSTNNYAEKYTYETSLGDFERVGEAGAYPRSGMQEGYSKTIEPDTYKNSFVVTQEMIEDAKMGKIKSNANKFMLSYARTKEKLAANMLANAFGTTYTVGSFTYSTACADALALFSKVHSSATGGSTQTNFYAAEFSYDNMCLLEEKMQALTDDDGNLLNIMPDTIIIPNKARIKKLVFDAVGAEEGTPGKADHSVNMQFGRWNVIVWPYLSNPAGTTTGYDAWYMMDSKFNDAYDGLIWLDRVPLSVKSYIDEDTDNNVWAGRARFMPGFNNWRAIMVSVPGTITQASAAGTTLS